jgi:hypothetical protein
MNGDCSYIKKEAAKKLLLGIFIILFDFGAGADDKIAITRGFDPTQIINDFKEALNILASVKQIAKEEVKGR